MAPYHHFSKLRPFFQNLKAPLKTGASTRSTLGSQGLGPSRNDPGSPKSETIWSPNHTITIIISKSFSIFILHDPYPKSSSIFNQHYIVTFWHPVGTPSWPKAPAKKHIPKISQEACLGRHKAINRPLYEWPMKSSAKRNLGHPYQGLNYTRQEDFVSQMDHTPNHKSDNNHKEQIIRFVSSSGITNPEKVLNIYRIYIYRIYIFTEYIHYYRFYYLLYYFT